MKKNIQSLLVVIVSLTIFSMRGNTQDCPDWDNTGGFFQSVLTITSDGNGNLYAAGTLADFSTGVAYWDGSFWTLIGTDYDGDVWDMAIAPNGNLYIGGSFSEVDGISAQNIAQWDGTSWSALGDGLDNIVTALIVSGSGTLYVGGNFQNSGMVSVSRIAKWDGSTWSALGSGMDNGVRALALGSDGTLYAGGLFLTAGGVNAKRVAKWDGNNWSALSTGMQNGQVNALALDQAGNLYACGSFTAPDNLISKWNGLFWSSLGAGISTPGYCNALTIDGNGTVYVGGDFFNPSNGIAQWDGNDWNTVGPGTGVEPNVTSLVTVNNFLFVGGLSICALPTQQVCGGILNIEIGSPPQNDLCTSATPLSPISQVCGLNQLTVDLSFANDSEQSPSPSCGSYNGKDVWFQAILPESGSLIIETSISGVNEVDNTAMEVYKGDCTDGLELIDCDDNSGDNNFSKITLSDCSLGGQTVFIRVWAVGGVQCGSFNICAYEGDTPPNPIDDCECSETLMVGTGNCDEFQITGTNVNATSSEGLAVPACGNYQGGDVWYNLVVPPSGHLVIETSDAGGIQNTAMEIYGSPQGDCTQTFDPLNDCNDDPEGGGGFAVLELYYPFLIGQTIWVRVWEPGNDDFGIFNICAYSPTPPDNNFCIGANNDAYTLFPSLDYADCISTTNEAAFDSEQTPVPQCGNYEGAADVWYKIVVPENANNIVIEASEDENAASLSGAALEVYSGDCTTGLVSLGCDDENSFGQVTIADPEIGGQELFARVWSPGNAEFGTFMLCAYTLDLPQNDFCVNATPLIFNNGSASDIGNTTDATDDGPLNCGLSSNFGVWYSFVAPPSGEVNLQITIPNGNIFPIATVFDVCNGSEVFCSNQVWNSDITGLLAGNTYYLLISSFAGNETFFQLSLEEIPESPPNDNCTSPIPIPVSTTGTCTLQPYSTSNATDSGTHPACDNFGTNLDIWFSFQAPSTGAVEWNFNGIDGPVEAAWWNACGGSPGQEVGCDNSVQDGDIIADLTPGNTYLLQIWNDNYSAGDFEFCLLKHTPPPPPVNNLCAGAIDLPVGQNGTCSNTLGTNENATDSGIPDPGCAGYQSGDVWYKVTVPASGDVTVETSLASGFADTGMAIYSGTNCNSLSLLKCDDNGGTWPYSKIELTGRTVGETLYVRVWEKGGDDVVTFNICAYEPDLTPPPNDLCTNAQVLSPITLNCGDNATIGTNVNATDSGQLPIPSCGDYQGGDIWYQVTVPASGKLTIETGFTGGLNEIGMEAFSGSCNGTLTSQSCTSDVLIDNFQLQIDDLTLAGQPLLIRVWAPGNNESGDFGICAFETPPPPANDNVCNAIDLTAFISDGMSHTYTNAGATVEDGEPAPVGGGCNTQNAWCINDLSATVWFSFVAPASGNINIDITNKIDLQMAVWEADDCSYILLPGQQMMVAANDNSGTGGGGAPQIIDLRCLIPGKTYYVQIDELPLGVADSFDIKIDDLGNTCPAAPIGLSCNNSFSSNSTASGEWLHLTDASGNVVASLNDMNNNLGTISAQANINNGTVRQDADGNSYLDRNFSISVGNQAPATVRFYLTPNELADLGVALPEVNLWHVPAGNCTDSYSSGGQLIFQSASKLAFDGTNHMVEFHIPGFSAFYLHGQSSVLPVELIDFKASKKADYIQLDWQTAYENNNHGFEIQQSTDVSSWQKIGFVKSRGNSHVISSYTFLDKKPQPGNNYYRLKQIDLDGASTYSKIVMAVFNRKGISFYPNPATKTITFNMKTIKTVDIYDIWGKKVLSREVASDLDISTLPSGVYVLDVNRGEYRERLVVE